MDKVARSSKIALIVTALFLVAALPITSVNAAPSEESEFFYGVEYDWSSIDSDLTNFTGLDLPEIFTEVMGAADDSGFDLIIGQLMTGSSNVYIHHTEDISPQTIKDYDGDSVSVWSRTTDVTLRHGGLVDGILMTDWSESTFGMNTTGFDIDITSSSQNVLSVDILYTEYLDDSYNLIGADMDFSMNTYTSTSFDFDATFEGDGEELPIDFNVAMSFGYSITDSSSQWRLESPDPIYVELSSEDDYGWGATGDLFGDYDGSIDYSFSVTGIPTEDFGFDSGEFDIEISDSLTQTDGDFEMGGVHTEFDFIMGDDMTVDLGDGNGLTTQVQSCENCPPGNPLMFVMMGNVIGGASEAFVDDIGESFSEGLSENLVELFDVGGDDDDYDDEYYDDWFYCDSGDVIYSWQQNNGYPDCYDGSDEEILMAEMSYSNDQDQFINIFTINNEMLNLNAGWPYYTCDDGSEIEWNMINDESWDDFDCESGEDEYDYEMIEDSIFTCEDDFEIPLSKVNDGIDDCMNGEDEPEYGDLEITEWYCGEDDVDIPLSEVNNGVVDCTDGWDEPRYDGTGAEISDFECLSGNFILLSQVNDGNYDCYDGDDESEYEYNVEISEFLCYENDVAIPLTEVNDGEDNCQDGSDEPVIVESNIEVLYTCSDGTEIFWSQVNDGTGDCADFLDEGVLDKYTLNYNIISEQGNVLHSESYDLCGQYIESACDDSIFMNRYYIQSTYTPSMNYGSNTFCINAELIDDSTNQVVGSSDLSCEDYYHGPHMYNFDVYDSDGYLNFQASAMKDESQINDVDMEITIIGPDSQVIYSSTMELDSNYNDFEESIAISEDGEYCVNWELVEDGESMPFSTAQRCEEVSSEGEPSDRLGKIAGAFSESSIGDVLEMFGENLQQRLDDTEAFETFPYNDGLWAPMWSNEHGAIVGIGVYAMDDDGAYTMAGPNTVGYMDDAPAKMSIRYLTGVEAGNAASSMEDADEIDEIVDVEQHDLEQITQDLEDAGIDTSGLDLPFDGSDSGETTPPETAIDSAEDDGLLPFASPISVIAVIALAGAIISSRKENE